jgi:phage tail protein X
MTFAVLKNDATIDDLAARLFSPEGKLSKTAAKHAVTVLLKANPQLEDLSVLPAGSLITIPDTAPAVVPSEAVPAPAPALAVAADRARELLEGLASQLSVIDVRARGAMEALAEIAKAKDVSPDVPDGPDLIKVLSFAGKPSKTIVKDFEKSLKARDEAIAGVLDHVASLAGMKAPTT